MQTVSISFDIRIMSIIFNDFDLLFLHLISSSVSNPSGKKLYEQVSSGSN